MNHRNLVGLAGIAALATGAVVIGQTGNQPERQPDRRVQPATPATPAQPADPSRRAQDGRTDPQAQINEIAQLVQDHTDRMRQMNERLLQQLTQAQLQQGEQRVNALAEVVGGILREHQMMEQDHAKLHRTVIRHKLDQHGLSDQWETLKSQYPFLSETRPTTPTPTGSGGAGGRGTGTGRNDPPR